MNIHNDHTCQSHGGRLRLLYVQHAYWTCAKCGQVHGRGQIVQRELLYRPKHHFVLNSFKDIGMYRQVPWAYLNVIITWVGHYWNLMGFHNLFLEGRRAVSNTYCNWHKLIYVGYFLSLQEFFPAKFETLVAGTLHFWEKLIPLT